LRLWLRLPRLPRAGTLFAPAVAAATGGAARGTAQPAVDLTDAAAAVAAAAVTATEWAVAASAPVAASPSAAAAALAPPAASK
jgi:hypothetical protein